MTISSQIELIIELAKTLPESPSAEVFNGPFTEDVLSKIKFDGSRPHILVGCGGGYAVEGSPRLSIDASFAAIICGRIDRKSLGASKIATDCAEGFAKKISNYRGDPKINTKLPVLKSIEEISSGLTNGTNYSVWVVDWEQRIALV